jgi:hypothetical protein
MLIPNHPDDELLAALASDDADAAVDASVTSHVAACAHCTALIDELGALRASLATLPDLQPPRPLRLLPDVPAPSGVDRAGSWARRLFGPVLATGATLAMVGLVGTAAPSLSGMAAGGADFGGQAAEINRASGAQTDSGGAPSSEEGAPAAAPGGEDNGEGEGDPNTQARESVDLYAESPLPEQQLFDFDASAERSVWPMLLFAGVALMIAAAMLRWILVPRAG